VTDSTQPLSTFHADRAGGSRLMMSVVVIDQYADLKSSVKAVQMNATIIFQTEVI
jgi:hypothetical protein